MQKVIYLDTIFKIFTVSFFSAIVVQIVLIFLEGDFIKFSIMTSIFVIEFVVGFGSYIWMISRKFIIYYDRLEYSTFRKKQIFYFKDSKIIFGPVVNEISGSTNNYHAKLFIKQKNTDKPDYQDEIEYFAMYKLPADHRKFYHILKNHFIKNNLEDHLEAMNFKV